MRGTSTAPRALCLAVGFCVAAAWALPAFGLSPMLRELENAFVRLHEEVRPSVVNIDAEGSLEGAGGNYEELYRFFGLPVPENQAPIRPPVSSGSGFIYDTSGHIVTNNHVVDGAKKLTVRLFDGSEFDATVVGRDPDTDMAVIKIDTGGRTLTAVQLGDSDAIKVGQFAIAVGSPRGLEGSLSFGHISALGRGDEVRLPMMRFKNFIQTDAAINLGNSGGPLCNIDGEVIGINTAIVFGAQSLGFAIPINMAKSVIPELIAKGKVTRGYLGVEIRDASDYAESLNAPDEDGAYVNNVTEGTAADRYGLKTHDIIRKINGEVVPNSSALIRLISELAPGSKVRIEVWRDGVAKEVEVVLDEYPGSLEAALQEAPMLGLRVQPLTGEMAERLGLEPGTTGVVATGVDPGSPAALAGVNPGDVILEVAQEKVTSVSQWRELIGRHAEPGKSLLIRTVRGTDRPTTRVIKVPDDFRAE